MTLLVVAILIGIVWTGCGVDHPAPIPEPIAQIERMYESDWLVEHKFNRARSVNAADVHLWYNVASQAELFSKFPSAVPPKNVRIFRFGSTPQLVYEIQLIATQSSSRYLLLVESFKCMDISMIDSCVNLASSYLKNSSNHTDMLPLNKFTKVSSNRGWLIGLRMMVAAAINQKVDVSDQYAIFLT